MTRPSAANLRRRDMVRVLLPWSFGALACAAAVGTSAPVPAPGCPALDLPAYAHNDYENNRPLWDALDLGYRGVEVDVFLVNGILRVGHDLRRARRGPRVETAYLAPLDSIGRACWSPRADHAPFLLTIELKHASHAAFDSLAALVRRYGWCARDDRVGAIPLAAAAVRIVLVGWHPPVTSMDEPWLGCFGVQHLVEQPHATLSAASAGLALVSVNYGKVAGRWRRAGGHQRVLTTIRTLRRTYPHQTLRVFNVPAVFHTYRSVLDAGADLVGTRTPERTRAMLSEGLASP